MGLVQLSLRSGQGELYIGAHCIQNHCCCMVPSMSTSGVMQDLLYNFTHWHRCTKSELDKCFQDAKGMIINDYHWGSFGDFEILFATDNDFPCKYLSSGCEVRNSSNNSHRSAANSEE